MGKSGRTLFLAAAGIAEFKDCDSAANRWLIQLSSLDLVISMSKKTSGTDSPSGDDSGY